MAMAGNGGNRGGKRARQSENPDSTGRLQLYVPEEIVKDILSRLPVNSLLRFKCVNKLWNSIISDPDFVLLNDHRGRVVFMNKRSQFICFHFMDYEGVVEEYLWLKNSSLNYEEEDIVEGEDFIGKDPSMKNNGICCMRNMDKFADDDFDDYYVDGETSIRKYPWEKEDEEEYGYRPYYCFVEGSCNGLLLVVVKESFFLWNPAIRYMNKVLELKRLADLEYKIATSLCYDSSTDNYKVVAGLAHSSPDYGGEFVIVASLKEKQWRRVKFPYQVSSMVIGPVVNGFLHWRCNKRPRRHDYDYFCDYYGAPHKIVAFDPMTDKFKKIPMPEAKNRSDGNLVLGLGVLGGCLCMSHWDNESDLEGNVEILVMKEYGVKESWTTMFEISNLEIRSPFYTILMPLLQMKNDEILLKMDEELLIYNPRKMTYRTVNAERWTRDGDIVVESLVSPTGYEWIKEEHLSLGEELIEDTEDSNAED